MAQKRRVHAPCEGIVLPDLAELQSDDLGLMSLTVSGRFRFENHDHLHHKPALAIREFSNRLRKDYGLVSWISTLDGKKAESTDVRALMELCVEDRQEVIVDLRGPKHYGVEKLGKVLGLHGDFLKDSRSQEDISVLSYLRDAMKILGKPLKKP
jgi:hypothetical protein